MEVLKSPRSENEIQRGNVHSREKICQEGRVDQTIAQIKNMSKQLQQKI